jgi:hypothetical protein
MVKVKFDPTVSLGHIGSAVAMVIMGLGAYYDLKSDVRDNKTVVDQRWEQQKLIDANQDQRLSDIKATVQTSTDEIKRKIELVVSRDPKR